MRLSMMLSGLALSLLAAPLLAADSPKAAVAEDKAQVLEEKVLQDAPPPKKTETITPTEVQAVDPAGQAADGRQHHVPGTHHLLGGKGCR